MSIGPVSGSGIAITLPVNKVIFWSALVQSSVDQFLQIKDSTNNVLFSTQGASSSGGTPTQIGEGFFQASDPSESYTVWIGTGGGQQWSRVLWTQDVITNAASLYFGKYLFSSEDSGDNDYNDSYLQIQWFQYLG
jgi:hypothetical protein